ncbi:hypothetical protein JCM3770_001849 [Rhodotorula araucariae]
MPPRRSTRKRKTAEDVDYEPSRDPASSRGSGEDEGTDEDFPAPSTGTSKRKINAGTKKGKGKAVAESDEEDYSPPKKKAKASAATKGKGKGRKPKKLELFQSMPLDVLALIMCQLDTKTLLAMSRTCSAFRSLLHSSQGTSCWKAARWNTSRIPDLEASDLEEWMYASLLFDSTCHDCQKPRAKTVDLDLRARGCAKCMRVNSLQASKISSSMHPRVWQCVPESQWSPESFGSDIFGSTVFGSDKTYTFFWEPTVEAVSTRLWELDGKDGFNDYVAQCKKDKAAAKRDASSIRQWEHRHRRDARDSARRALTSRRQKIKENLLALGYTSEEANCQAVTYHSSFNQETELTDRAWSVAKPKLVAVIEEHRTEMHQRELALAMKDRGDKLKPFYDALHFSVPSGEARMLFPPWGNFLHLPAVKQLYVPEVAHPTDKDLNSARAAIMGEAQAFGVEIRNAFLGGLVKAHVEAGARIPMSPNEDGAVADPRAVEELVRRVSSAVRCPSRGCRTMAVFPDILDHVKVCMTRALTEDSLKVPAQQIRAIRHILSAINADEPGPSPEATTTTGALYAVGKAFECQSCQSQQAAVGPAVWSMALDPKMGWTEAVTHLTTGKHENATVFPTILYTPPAPRSDGVDNPGGFVDDEAHA